VRTLKIALRYLIYVARLPKFVRENLSQKIPKILRKCLQSCSKVNCMKHRHIFVFTKLTVKSGFFCLSFKVHCRSENVATKRHLIDCEALKTKVNWFFFVSKFGQVWKLDVDDQQFLDQIMFIDLALDFRC